MGLGQKWDGFEIFTVEEAGCEILRLSRESAYAAARSGELPTVRIGRRLLVPRKSLERILEGADRSSTVGRGG
jgi:excisionase family DNA binding protein